MPEVTFTNGPSAKASAPSIKPADGNIQPQAGLLPFLPLDVAQLRVLKKDGLRHTFSVTVRIPGTDAATAGNYFALFFIARRPYEIISCKERHEVAGSDGSPVTFQLNKVPNGTAPASGTSILTTGLSLKSTADTLQAGTITAVIANRRLVDGDGLCLETSGTLTAVAGVSIVVELKAI